MTEEVLGVLQTIAKLFLVILAGLFLGRKKLLDGRTTSKLSGFVVDVAFPALVFTSMLRTVDPQSLARSWYLPVFGMAILLAGMGIGYAVAPRDGGRGSSAFAMGTPNWLFIPLPIAIALYGQEGERAVLLVNMGAMLVFWSVGLWLVRGGRPDSETLKRLALNPGLLATVLGIVIALLLPLSRTLEQVDVREAGPAISAMAVAVRATAFVGEVTIPLSMIVTGAMLAGTGAGAVLNRRVFWISAVRLAVIPALALLLMLLADTAGLKTGEGVRVTLVIIAAMPIAVTCSVVAEKHGGDAELVSGAIFLSTVASVATVPAMVWLMRAAGF